MAYNYNNYHTNVHVDTSYILVHTHASLEIFIMDNNINLDYYFRSATSHRIRFVVPEPLLEHLEVLPKHGLLQADSCFAAQLKFQPQPSILTDCQQYCSATGSTNETLLVMPVQISVADLVCIYIVCLTHIWGRGGSRAWKK